MAGTPNIRILESAVLRQFPDARFGRFNCRHIGSNSLRPWSQHAGSEPATASYGNALDISHADYHGKVNPAHTAWLIGVYRFIRSHQTEFQVDQLLGPGDAGHDNHVHASTWPKMRSVFWYKPPCQGGNLQVEYKDGTTDTTFGTPPPPIMEDDMAFLPLDYGDGYPDGTTLTHPVDGEFVTDRHFKRSDVRAVQGMLAEAGAVLTLDGLYGDETAAAMMEIIPASAADSQGNRFHGNDWTPLLLATIPQGKQGKKGDPGSQGLQGIQGVHGKGLNPGDVITSIVQ